MGKYYLAYGSNLSNVHMARCCPDAVPVGRGVLRGYRLTFRVHATIEKCEGCTVPVGIWKISHADEGHLDWYEGFPNYYHKETIPVMLEPFDGSPAHEISAMAYIMNDGHPTAPPTVGYMDCIRRGYACFGLDARTLREALACSLAV